MTLHFASLAASFNFALYFPGGKKKKRGQTALITKRVHTWQQPELKRTYQEERLSGSTGEW